MIKNNKIILTIFFSNRVIKIIININNNKTICSKLITRVLINLALKIKGMKKSMNFDENIIKNN